MPANDSTNNPSNEQMGDEMLLAASPMATRRRSLAASLAPKLTGAVAVVPLLILVLIVGALIIDAIPAIKVNGWAFLYGHGWNVGNTYGSTVVTAGVTHPQGSSYGAFPLIVGTLQASLVAVVIAVPLSILAALAIVERLPKRLSSSIGFFLETLAGIPSVVFGLWGALTIGPLLSRDVYPLLANHAPNVWGLSFFRGSTGNGEGLLTSGIVLAIMIVPIVAATARDLLRQVPTLAKDGARALGMTEWEVTRHVTVPWIRAGLIGASVLGLARALGETMAVAMVSGTALGAVAPNAYSPMTTIAATIVSQLDSAFTDATGFAVHTLAEAALLLVAITILTNLAARLLVRRVASSSLPVGRGI